LKKVVFRREPKPGRRAERLPDDRESGARRLSGHVLDDQHRGLVCVVLANAHHAHVLYPNGIVSSGRQFGTALCSVGGSAGEPSVVSTLKKNPAS
jgi:hypothetical protein